MLKESLEEPEEIKTLVVVEVDEWDDFGDHMITSF
tara:strand:- start:381 stop:485 length:105 start_codon:yes stop_codon:yes gene_type:complete